MIKMFHRSFLLTLILLISVASPAFAAISSIIVQDKNSNEYFMFDYPTLIDSYTRKVVGQPAVVYDAFSGKKVAALAMRSNTYIDYDAVLTAYTHSIVKGEKFNLVKFLESPTAKPFILQEGTKRVTVQEGKLAYELWDISALAQSLRDLNNAAASENVLEILVTNAITLGLNLTEFEKLNTYGKELVAKEIIAQKAAAAYQTAQDVQYVFDGVVSRAQAVIQEAVSAVNAAAWGRPLYDTVVAQDMKRTLLQYAAPLELNMARFSGLPVFSKDWIAMRVMAKSQEQPFAAVAAVTETLNAKLDTADKNIIFNDLNYDYTLQAYTDLQMRRNPQTDLYNGTWQPADRVDVQWHVNPQNFDEDDKDALEVNADVLRVRRQPVVQDGNILTHIRRGEVYIIQATEMVNGQTWYRITAHSRTGWVLSEHVTLTRRKTSGIFQFLILSGTAGIPEAELNKLLAGRGILADKGAAFLEGTRQHNINEIFLVSLALHESGNGTSTLATGVVYEGPDGPKTVYNMYGIGAVDADPVNMGAKYAYEQGWFTPELAIIGGARFIGNGYINNLRTRQDTLHKMRWNPAPEDNSREGWRQYATDIGWASKQSKRIESNMKALYEQCETYLLRFDIPRFRQ